MDSPLLTILVPVFNERETVRRTLELVQALSYEKQVIVVDDGSTDGTAEVLAEFERTGSRSCGMSGIAARERRFARGWRGRGGDTS